jgi:hypothetical protein
MGLSGRTEDIGFLSAVNSQIKIGSQVRTRKVREGFRTEPGKLSGARPPLGTTRESVGSQEAMQTGCRKGLGGRANRQ